MSSLMNGKNNINVASGGDSSDDVVSVKDRDDTHFEDERTSVSGGARGTYPADCYSFMAVHGPFDGTHYFYFGFLVWVFQIIFLSLLVMRVAVPKLSTNENDDNPDQGQGGFWNQFVPSNNNNVSKATQVMSLLTYCIFADATLKDIVTSVETFPRFDKANPGDKIYRIIFSCILRFTQGMMATFVVFLLVVNTSDVIDIILNFTAVNFISDFDDIAFELAQWGKYGPRLKAEADRIEKLPAPKCIFRKYQHVRYVCTVIPIAITLLICLGIILNSQDSLDIWLTKKLRVQFKDDPLRNDFNGCYHHLERKNKRVLFESDGANAKHARFGYCQPKKKWYLYTGNKTSACDLTSEEMIMFSTKTYAFDISTVFEDTWYSPTGTPLELYFFDDTKNELSDEECKSFLGDGECDDAFNILDHNYDEGDCCAPTCESLNCGIKNSIENVFNNNVTSGNGYDRCKDSRMKPITIKLNNVYIPVTTFLTIDNPSPFEFPLQDPLLRVDCDGKEVLMANINGDMKFEAETLWVADGADCTMAIKNATGGPRDLPFVNYTVYHGTKESIETDPIVMFNADSSEDGIYNFKRIPECFFEKLNGHINTTRIYTDNEASTKAIRWLVQDSTGYSNCEFDTFLERYALATINYAAPRIDNGADLEGGSSELWISAGRQCYWPYVSCIDGRVFELDLGAGSDVYVSGTIATEIGLLSNLVWLDFAKNELYGSIPSQIGEWHSLLTFNTEYNGLTGTIPTEIGESALEALLLGFNQLSGTIPSEIGEMENLGGLVLIKNNLVGSIPNEIGGASSMEYLILGNNTLTGTIPTVLGLMTNMIWFESSFNFLTGTLPTELGLWTNIDNLQIVWNQFTGSIPTEILNLTFLDFETYGNRLSNLIPVEGRAICDEPEYFSGAIYCNCESDCSINPWNCYCEDAISCCTSYMEQFTACSVCSSGTLENPNEMPKDYLLNCKELEAYFRGNQEQFGTEEMCDQARLLFESVGCKCGNVEENDDSEEETSADAIDV